MNPPTMGLAEALARDVSERTRTRGNRYFLGGAVRAIEGSGSEVVATVRGSEWYRVRLSRDGDAFFGLLPVPLLRRSPGFLQTHLGGRPGRRRRGPAARRADHRGCLPRAGARTTRPRCRAPGARVPAPPREAWQRFLQSVQERSASPALPYASRYSQGELLYVIDRQSARGELVPTVQVHWRTRKKNGEWGKPQPAALAIADVPHLADPDDREIVSLLLGATDPQAAGLQYVSVATRASFRITGPLIERVLPLIAPIRPAVHARGRPALAGSHAARSGTTVRPGSSGSMCPCCRTNDWPSTAR